MKLLNNMFLPHGWDASGTQCAIGLNADHPIYRAHFPGHPITPGVCIIGLVVELAEQKLQTTLELVRVKNLKFIQPLSPEAHPEVTIRYDHIDQVGTEVRLRGTVSHEETVFAKFSIVARITADA